MKKMSVKKEILTIVMIVVVVLAISSQVLATGTSDSPIQIPTINTGTNSVDTNTTTNVVTNVVVPTTNTVTPTTNTTNTTVSTYQNTTTLPQTGDASDYAIFMLIVVAIVVAIYAYRKVKEYNV